MKKRIEDFAPSELWNVFNKSSGSFQAVLDYIKANLDTGKTEPMATMDLREVVWDAASGRMTEHEVMAIVKAIQPLTVQQGFVVDWSDAPREAKSFRWGWSDSDDEYHTGENQFWTIGHHPSPAPKMRKRTDHELAEAVLEWIGWNNGRMHELDHDTLVAIAVKAKIDLEVQE